MNDISIAIRLGYGFLSAFTGALLGLCAVGVFYFYEITWLGPVPSTFVEALPEFWVLIAVPAAGFGILGLITGEEGVSFGIKCIMKIFEAFNFWW
jgi:hypothetical protein